MWHLEPECCNLFQLASCVNITAKRHGGRRSLMLEGSGPCQLTMTPTTISFQHSHLQLEADSRRHLQSQWVPGQGHSAYLGSMQTFIYSLLSVMFSSTQVEKKSTKIWNLYVFLYFWCVDARNLEYRIQSLIQINILVPGISCLLFLRKKSLLTGVFILNLYIRRMWIYTSLVDSWGS